LIGLAGLAPFAVLHSEMPRAVAWPLAAMAAAWGAWSAWREARRPARQLDIGAGKGDASLDGQALVLLELQWRGPIAFLHWRDHAGLGGRLAWWPDTLPPAKRRELRLTAGMAP
jgi:toxin CptA